MSAVDELHCYDMTCCSCYSILRAPSSSRGKSVWRFTLLSCPLIFTGRERGRERKREREEEREEEGGRKRERGSIADRHNRK